MLQLHRWDAHNHPHLGDEETKPYGNGSVLWFETTDFDLIESNVARMNATILEKAHVNTNANYREMWIEDLDGYVVVIAGPMVE